jgi:predicted ATPase
MTFEAFVRSVQLLPAGNGEQRVGYPWELPAIEALTKGLELHHRGVARLPQGELASARA